MGFLSGRVTFVRYRVQGESPLPFGEEVLGVLGGRVISGSGGETSADGVTVGWAGGDHVLDGTFALEKNVLGDALHFALRIDTNKVPGELLKAYTQIELKARAAGNPSGRPSKAQREEAKEAAQARAEAEGADGRFRRRKHYPILWDGQRGILYAGTTSVAVLDRFVGLFRESFGRALTPITAGRLASDLAEARGEGERIAEVAPIGFVGEEGVQEIAWSGDGADPNYLGNEFLVWLWHRLQQDGAAVELADGSSVEVMFAKTLTLDCPLGQTGSDSLRDEGPTRLPEALRALQSGKLPRKVGLVLARHGQQYELTLQAETMAISGLALPKVEELDAFERNLARIEALRHLDETLELLYDAFGRHRTGPGWSGELGRIRDWLRAA